MFAKDILLVMVVCLFIMGNELYIGRQVCIARKRWGVIANSSEGGAFV